MTAPISSCSTTDTLAPMELSKAAVMHLHRQGFAQIEGSILRKAIHADDNLLSSFSRYWDSLKLDQYMADNGTYRFRRYSHFKMDSPQNPLQLQPHEPYSQPRHINTLNGGRDRYYLPLEQGFITHPLFDTLLRYLAGVYNRAEGRPQRWIIRLHPYRIVASQAQMGKPTPEGLHRDGVDYLTILMIRRHHVTGGCTTITDNRHQPIHTTTLLNPFDLIMVADNRVMHEVTPIENTHHTQGFRDVLLVAFEKA